MMAGEGKVNFALPVPVHQRLLAVQAKELARKGYGSVTLADTIGILIDCYDEREGRNS